MLLFLYSNLEGCILYLYICNIIKLDLILYILLFNALTENFKLKKALIVSLAIVFLYSCSDELHQYFIPGRTARVRDVIIDTCGGIFALLILYLRRKSLLKKQL